jgi:hypothetical protein
MTKQGATCCSSAAMWYWFVVSAAAWGVLSLIGMYWEPLQASSAAACLLAMAIGCFANWFRNRTFHCGITGPIFLVAGALSLASDVRLIRFNESWLWACVLTGVGIAFLLEWVYARHRES